MCIAVRGPILYTAWRLIHHDNDLVIDRLMLRWLVKVLMVIDVVIGHCVLVRAGERAMVIAAPTRTVEVHLLIAN